MTIPVKDAVRTLSEKEKQTLRLIVRGHDAKSTARSLGLSVHTINERLREARRKMAVSSSREAARILLAAEGADSLALPPNSSGDVRIGEASGHASVEQASTLALSGSRRGRRPWIFIGGFFMTIMLGLLLVAALPQSATLSPSMPSSVPAAADPDVLNTAQQWLSLLDQSRWAESYRETGESFRTLNTAEVWAAASREARLPLGTMISRTFLSQENLPAPPAGYEVMKFRTRFANRAEAIETVTLNREGGRWRVVGVMIG